MTKNVFIVFWWLYSLLHSFGKPFSLMKIKVKSLSYVRLFVIPWTSPPGSSVHGIFQAWILEWVAISFSRGSSQPRDRTRVSCIVGKRFTIWATREALRPRSQPKTKKKYPTSTSCLIRGVDVRLSEMGRCAWGSQPTSWLAGERLSCSKKAGVRESWPCSRTSCLDRVFHHSQFSLRKVTMRLINMF